MGARDGLWKPAGPEWLWEAEADIHRFLKSLREDDDMTEATAVVRQDSAPARPPMLRPVAPIAEILHQQTELRQYIKAGLKDGRDFGIIPGVDKASLLKPGAERINTAYGVAPRFTVVASEIDHDREVKWVKRRKEWRDRQWTGNWIEDTGVSLGLYSYTVRCELVERSSGVVVADCIGNCSTMESKYIDRPRDSQNTALKMAEKRAFVGATLLAYGLSDEFTQDVEDTDSSGAVDTKGGDDAPVVEKAAVCPKCAGPMWDNRQKKTNPKAPDFKCKKQGCDGVIWPQKGKPKTAAAPVGAMTDDPGPQLDTPTDDLPF